MTADFWGLKKQYTNKWKTCDSNTPFNMQNDMKRHYKHFKKWT